MKSLKLHLHRFLILLGHFVLQMKYYVFQLSGYMVIYQEKRMEEEKGLLALTQQGHVPQNGYLPWNGIKKGGAL